MDVGQYRYRQWVIKTWLPRTNSFPDFKINFLHMIDDPKKKLLSPLHRVDKIRESAVKR